MAAVQTIAYLMGSWPVWSETFIQQELDLLISAGLPIVPIAISPANREPTAGMPAVAILETAPHHQQTPPPGKNHEWTPILVRRQAALIKHSGKIRTLVDMVREHNVVHIHAAFAGLPGLLTSAACRKTGIAYSVSVHANDALCSKYDDRYIFDHADVIYGCNRRVLAELENRSPWLSDQLEYVPHGLQLGDWPMREFRAPGSPIRFLFVGRMVEKKDPAAAARLIETLNQQGIEAEITFVGDGPLAGTVPTRGVLSRNEVRDLMNNHDFLISTSRELDNGDMEGVPNVILEAMAAGLPVLAPATGGINEILSDETGFIIDPEDSGHFCRTIVRVTDNPSILNSKTAAARKAVERDYQAETNITKKVDRLRPYLAG